ncbi:unnamed protein product [Cylindrotheca closterium]|uniref:Uncharacterized protein n=1 Tax=Cylindrotheca closterium TaxID=2856 RepID=A0AAD2CQR2_9STRA|nr:unnamed protein product [Cylindrotheca closterium]
MDNSPVSKRRRKTASDKSVLFLYTGQPESKIPKNITHIAFDPCVQEIPDWAFTDSKLLQSIDIPATVKSIGVESFSGCDSLTKVSLGTGLRNIGRSSFFQCRAMVAIQLNHGLESIGGGAFEECESLMTVAIPSTMETIGDDVFQDCASLTSVIFQDEGLMKRIGRRAFCRCESLQQIELPRGLTEINFCCFSGCDALKTVSIPDTVETIDTSAFDSCRGLVDVHFRQGLARIGTRAFARCISLSAISLPFTVHSINSHAFKDCTSLLGVEIPEGVLNCIDPGSFDNCTSLITVSVPALHRYVMSGSAFSGCRLLVKDDNDEAEIDAIRHRFDNLPVHHACYNASMTSVDKLTQIINETTNSMEGKNLEDHLGLSPLHIVATSASLRVDFFECLLDRYPAEVIWHCDNYGKTAIDYLLAHTSSKAVSLIQVALRRSILDKIPSRWGLPMWRTKLEGHIGSMPSDNDTRARSAHLHETFQYLGYYARIEMTSLAELALWKMRMSSSCGHVKGEFEIDDQNYRKNCKLQCGSEIVIENMIEYLWNGESSRSDTSLSMFPLCGNHHWESG